MFPPFQKPIADRLVRAAAFTSLLVTSPWPYCDASNERTLQSRGPQARVPDTTVSDLLESFDARDEAAQIKIIEKIGTLLSPDGFGKGPAADQVEIAVRFLVDAVQRDHRSVRQAAASALAQAGPRAASQANALADALSGADPDIREEIAQSLELIGPNGLPALPVLLKHLESPDDGLRNSAALAIGGMGPGAIEALPSLVKMLSDKIPSIRSQSALAIGGLGPAARTAIPRLREALQDEDHSVRLGAINALGMVGGDPHVTVPLIANELASEDVATRVHAALALGEFGSEAGPAIHSLVKALKDDNFDVRRAAARSLVRIGPSASQALIPTLEDEQIRVAGIQILGEIGPGASVAVPALATLALKCNEVEVRWWAIWAMGEMQSGAKDGVRALVEILRDPDATFRMAAARALGEIGLNTPEVLSALTKISVDDPETEVRRAAELTIEIIE